MAVIPSQEEYTVSFKDQNRRAHAMTLPTVSNPSSAMATDAGRTVNSTPWAYRQRPQQRWIKTSAGLQMRWVPAEI